MARKRTAPKLGSDTRQGQRGHAAQLDDPNGSCPLHSLDTPELAALHIRAGVETVYQTSSLGDGYIEGAGCHFPISAEEEERRNNAKTDNGRIKMISSSEETLVPLLLAVYMLVANKMYGVKLNGEEYQQRVEKAAKVLGEWYTQHATGPSLGVPLAFLTVERVGKFMREDLGGWREMEWWRSVPGNVGENHQPAEPATQPLQERDANTVMRDAEPEDDSTKKRGIKKSSPAAATSKKDDKTNGKNHDNSVPSAADLSTIHLPGEEDEETPIFDTCDDIRKKLTEALKHTTQAHLAREFTELLPTSSLSSRQLGAFLKFKGPQAGAHSTAFYAGYVYFEKIRVKEGKKKTAKREKMEEKWRKLDVNRGWQANGSRLGGFPRTGSHNAHLTCIQGERWRLDQYGEVQIYGQPKGGGIMRKKPAKNPWS